MDPNLESLLECSVCLEALGPQHKVLPCQHTFCTTCLAHVKKKQASQNGSTRLLCPECRTPCDAPIDTLPSNIILNRILGTVAKEKSQSKDDEETPLPNIPGNLATNPFVELLQSSSSPSPHRTESGTPMGVSSWPGSRTAGMTGAQAGMPAGTKSVMRTVVQSGTTPTGTKTAISSIGTRVLPSAGLPKLPAVPMTSRTTPMNPNANPIPSASTSPFQSARLYKALYDYSPQKADELALRKGDHYLVFSKCQDGWFKGASVQQTSKMGVFPGNYVSLTPPAASGDSLDSSQQLLCLGEKWPKKMANTPEIPESRATAASFSQETKSISTSVHGGRYRCIMAYPSSSQFELELKEGDIIILEKSRLDGWCRGLLQRTGQSGLFPASFVEKCD